MVYFIRYYQFKQYWYLNYSNIINKKSLISINLKFESLVNFNEIIIHLKKQYKCQNSCQCYNIRMFEEIQLEISINIGEKTYKLEVPKQSNLSQIVHVFLKVQKLNPKYHQQILQLIKQQLQHRNQSSVLDQVRQAKNQMERKKKSKLQQLRTVTNQQKNTQNIDQNSYRSFNKKNQSKETNKNIILGKIQNVIHEIQSSNHQTPECQKAYEQWKQKEKQKNTSKSVNKLKQAVNIAPLSPLTKPNNVKNQTHQPSYFYNKGLAFNKVKQTHIQDKFKQCYPFTTRKDHNITSKEKNLLHQKLYIQSKYKKIDKIKTQINEMGEQDKSFRKQNKPTVSPLKERISKRRNQIDNALAQLLQQGKLSKATEIKVVKKSPFRKTKVY